MALSKVKVANLRNPKVLLSILLQLSILLVSVSYSLMYPSTAQAKVTTSYVRFDRQSNGALLGGVVCVADDGTSPNGQSQGINKVIVNFPSSFSLAATGWTADVTAGNLPTGVTNWTVNPNPVAVDTSTKSAIFVVTQDLTTSATYCFHFTATGSNVGTGGNDQNAQVWAQKVSAGGLTTPVINFGYATSIISTANGEQIGVTASVSGTFTFALSGGASGQTLPLGVLSSSTTSTSPYTVTGTVTTNATRGYMAWVKSTNAALNSAATSGTVPSVISASSVDLTSSTGYGLYAFSAAATITAPFNGSPTIGGGNGVGQVHSTQFDQIASSAVSVAGQTFQIGTRAKLAGTEKPATDYADTITVVAAGSF